MVVGFPITSRLAALRAGAQRMVGVCVLQTMSKFESGIVDLVVTSHPYIDSNILLAVSSSLFNFFYELV